MYSLATVVCQLEEYILSFDAKPLNVCSETGQCTLPLMHGTLR